jgi:hypothetical protein
MTNVFTVGPLLEKAHAELIKLIAAAPTFGSYSVSRA